MLSSSAGGAEGNLGDLAAGQEESDWAAQTVGQGVDLRWVVRRGIDQSPDLLRP